MRARNEQFGSGAFGKKLSKLPASNDSCKKESSSHTKADVDLQGDWEVVSLSHTPAVNFLVSYCTTSGAMLNGAHGPQGKREVRERRGGEVPHLLKSVRLKV